jgi:tRNA modification GTPase
MFELYDERPIIACSTGTVTNSAIGLIRLSGFKNLLDFQFFFSFDLNKVKPRYNHFSKLISNGQTLDEVVFSYYPGPNSYNGENILEISVHGNQINIQNIIKCFIDSGLVRHAKEGEFSYRALKNNKLTLTQVEGLDLLLNANSNYMLEQGLDILQGDLHSKYKALHDSFLKLKSSVEIGIDFSEDVGEENCSRLLKESLAEFTKIISTLHKRIQGDMSELTSPSVSLVGQTNAGKSSLFNLLLDSDRSIVSNIAGTTRDYVSEFIKLEGNNFRLIDTAGLRETDDVIEKIGIDRAVGINSKSFFKILVVNPLETNLNDYKKIENDHFDLVVFSHKDKVKKAKLSELLDFLPNAEYSIFTDLSGSSSRFIETGSIGPIQQSGPMGAGDSGSIEPGEISGPMGAKVFGPIEPKQESGPIEPIQIRVNELVLRKFNTLTSAKPLLISRHRQDVNDIYLEFEKFTQITQDIDDIAIISNEINILGTKISQLIGILSPDDVLNNIFSNFCIGK